MELEQSNITHAQKERLSYIDFSLEYFGLIGRKELMQHFATSSDSCTRDFSLYNKLAPDNAVFRHQDKKYHRANSFKALFQHDTDIVLTALSKGFGNGFFPEVSRKPSVVFMDTHMVKVNALATINRAILSLASVDIEYIVPEKNKAVWSIIPHALFQGYKGWYIRALNTSRNEYKNYFLPQILIAKTTDQQNPFSGVQKNDIHWNERVTLRLGPHQSVKNKGAIESMFNMLNGELVIHTNRVIAIHILNTLNVELSNQNECCAQQFYLSLLNADELGDIEPLGTD